MPSTLKHNEENETPNSIRIRVCTWNVGNAPPSHNLAAWLGPLDDCDLLVVGVQESCYAKKGEVRHMVKSQVKEMKLRNKRISTLQRSIVTGHKLEYVRFGRPRYCCVCNDSIAGHGLRCSLCKLNLHERCERLFEVACQTVLGHEKMESKSNPTSPRQGRTVTDLNQKRPFAWHDYRPNISLGWCDVCSRVVLPLRGKQCRACHVLIHISCETLLVTPCKIEPISGGGPRPANHELRAKTYHKLAYCDVCNGVLWGIRRQGQECTQCNIKIHTKCAAWLSTPCATSVGPSEEDQSESEDGPDDSVGDELWYNHLEECLNGELVCVTNVQLLEIRVSLFARPNIVMQIEQVVTKKEATGVAGVIGNKGGCTICIQLKNRKICFVACHLAAHEGLKYQTARNDNIYEITRVTKLGKNNLDMQYECDHVFWLGDLNYRLDISKTNHSEDWDKVHKWRRAISMVDRQEYSELSECDELRYLVQNRVVLTGFKEGGLTFAPTFKVERRKGTNYLEQRIPAYCDRILWHSQPNQMDEIELTSYNSVESIDTSDHKPVYATFNLNIKPPSHPIPHKKQIADGLKVPIFRTLRTSFKMADTDQKVLKIELVNVLVNFDMASHLLMPLGNGYDSPIAIKPFRYGSYPYTDPAGGLTDTEDSTSVEMLGDETSMTTIQLQDEISMTTLQLDNEERMSTSQLKDQTSMPIIRFQDEDSSFISHSYTASRPFALMHGHFLGSLTRIDHVNGTDENTSSISLPIESEDINRHPEMSLHQILKRGGTSRRLNLSQHHKDKGSELERIIPSELLGKFVPRIYCRLNGGTTLGSEIPPRSKSLLNNQSSLHWTSDEEGDNMTPLNCGPMSIESLNDANMIIVLNKVAWGQQHSFYAMAALPLSPLANIAPGNTVSIGPVPITRSTRGRGTIQVNVRILQ